jgi:hypothetical protein
LLIAVTRYSSSHDQSANLTPRKQALAASGGCKSAVSCTVACQAAALSRGFIVVIFRLR